MADGDGRSVNRSPFGHCGGDDSDSAARKKERDATVLLLAGFLSFIARHCCLGEKMKRLKDMKRMKRMKRSRRRRLRNQATPAKQAAVLTMNKSTGRVVI
jgi:hypothetical protein